MFDELAGREFGLDYDPTKTVTHVEDDTDLIDNTMDSTKDVKLQRKYGKVSTKSLLLDMDKSKSGIDEEGEKI